MRRLLIPVLIAASLLAAGCGGDGADTATDDETSTTAAEQTTAGDDVATTESASPDESEASGEAVPSAGCTSAPHAEVTAERQDIAVDGTDRYYLLTSPDDADPLPLVVDLHGFMEGADVHFQHSLLGEVGLEEGFATAFPNGTGDPVAWQVDDVAADLAYIDALVAEVGEERCIDTSRVYATGLSMGAMMTSILACERADTFAAFAPVNGLRLPEDCTPSRPLPMLVFHGTADPILLFNGGIDTSSFAGGEPGASATIPAADLGGEGYPATAAAWADVLGCTDPTDAEDPPVITRTWACPEGAALEFDIVEGHGHGWPGSPFAAALEDIMGPAVEGVDANERMWEFFQQHQLPTA